MFDGTQPLNPVPGGKIISSNSSLWKTVRSGFGWSRARFMATWLTCAAVALGGVSHSAEAGEWKVRLEAQGISRADLTSNPAWETSPFVGARAWQSVDGKEFSDSVEGYVGTTLEANHGQVPLTAAHSEIECSGGVTAVLRWVPSPGKTLKEDPAPVEVQVWEFSSAGWTKDSLTQFTTSGRVLECASPDAVETGETMLARGVESTVHSTLENRGRSTVLRLPTRHLKMKARQDSNGPQQYGGVYHAGGVNYRIGLGPVDGAAQLVVYSESFAGGGNFNGGAGQSLRINTNAAQLKTGTPRLTNLNSLMGSNVQPLNGPIWLGIEFEAGPQARLDPVTGTVTVRVQAVPEPELGAQQPGDQEKYIDLLFPLSGSDTLFKRQKRIGVAGSNQWVDTTEPFSTPAPDDAPVAYRVVVPVGTGKRWKVNGQTLDFTNRRYTIKAVKVDGEPNKGVDFRAKTGNMDLHSRFAQIADAEIVLNPNELRIKLHITKDVTKITSDIYAGQKVSLLVESTAGAKISGIKWVIDPNGKPFANWTANKTKAVYHNASKIVLNQKTLNFFWCKSGLNLSVSVSATVNGVEATTETAFNVTRPAGEIWTETGKIFARVITTVPPEYPQIQPGRCLGFGDLLGGLSPGIEFTAALEEVYGGQLQWVQVQKKSKDISTVGTTSTTINRPPGLDTNYPYGLGISEDDSPGTYRLSDTLSKYYREDLFVMYLMWRPPGTASIFIPLRKVEWGWHGTAGVVNGAWVLKQGAGEEPAITPLKESEAFEPPTWTRNIAG